MKKYNPYNGGGTQGGLGLHRTQGAMHVMYTIEAERQEQIDSLKSEMESLQSESTDTSGEQQALAAELKNLQSQQQSSEAELEKARAEADKLRAALDKRSVGLAELEKRMKGRGPAVQTEGIPMKAVVAGGIALVLLGLVGGLFFLGGGLETLMNLGKNATTITERPPTNGETPNTPPDATPDEPIQQVAPAFDPTVEPAAHTIQFPTEASLGTVMDRPWDSNGEWKSLGKARGDFAIKAGTVAKLRMITDSDTDTSVLSDLDHDDLYALEFMGSGITNETMKDIRNLTALQDLSVMRAEIDSEGFAFIHRFAHIKTLNVRGVTLDAAAIAEIARLSSLTELDIRDSGATTSAITKLSELTNLKTLKLPDTVDRAGYILLTTSLPDCDITPNLDP